MTGRLVSVGNVIIDLTVGIPALPARGGDVLGRSHGSAPGGSFNTMVAASRQGLAAAYGGAHGVGPFGDQVRAGLRAEGIAALLAPIPGIDTGFDVALTDGDGERTFVTVFGAEAALSGDALAGIRLGVGDLVHLSGYGLLEASNAEAIAPWLRTIGESHVVLVDPGPLAGDIPSDVWHQVVTRAQWLSCNLREARLLTGQADATAAATTLALASRGVVVRLGRDGCLLATGGTITHVAGFRVEVRDTNGAGDAHVGAFLAGLDRGEQPETAARTANACAAISVSRRGPATAPTLAETAALLG